MDIRLGKNGLTVCMSTPRKIGMDEFIGKHRPHEFCPWGTERHVAGVRQFCTVFRGGTYKTWNGNGNGEERTC